MSLCSDGTRILCDGEACEEQTFVPVALPVLANGAARRQPEPNANWLYVKLNGVWRHYCPNCSRQFHLAHAEVSDIVTTSKKAV